jgi:hypothetical protein
MILLMLTLMAQAKWQAPAICPDNLALAQEMVRYKLSGASQMSNSKCVDQSLYKNIRAIDQFVGEEIDATFDTVRSYKIQEVKEVEINEQKEIQISLLLEIEPKKYRTETFTIIRMDTAPNKPDFGCAMVGSQDLQGIYILSSCK